MSVPPDSQWKSGPTQRLPGRAIHPARPRVPERPQSRHGCMIGFMATVGVLLLIVGGVAYWGYSRFKTTARAIIIEPPTREVPGGQGPLPTPDIVKEPFNILLVGVDSRESTPEEGARSDTMILVHVDPLNKWASMLSIPRDSCAFIEGSDNIGGCEKINNAYSVGYSNAPAQRVKPELGGIAQARNTLEDYLDLRSHGQRIDFVAQVDFKGFQRIVDRLGGINIDVPRPLLDPSYPSDDGDNGYLRLYVPAGYQHMDGITALRYARSRHSDALGDYGRSQRQQAVIQAMMATLREKGMLDQFDTLNGMLDELATAFSTDLPIDDLGNARALASLARDLAGGRIQNYAIGPGMEPLDFPQPYTPRWDPADIDVVVRQWLSGPASQRPAATAPVSGGAGNPQGAGGPDLESLTLEVMNGAGIAGLARDVSGYLSNQGYTVASPSTASAELPYDQSWIIDYGDNEEAREQLARRLGIKSKYIVSASDAPEQPTDPDSDIVLLLGRDYQQAWRGAGR